MIEDERKNLSEEEIYKIQAFRYTYNALYIEDLSQEKRDLASNNHVLKRLADNIDIPKTYITDYIEGPITFTKVKFKNELKIFYIFGERHIDTRGECLNISNAIEFTEYIKRLSIESPSFFDLYFESELYENDKTIFQIGITFLNLTEGEDFETAFRRNENINYSYTRQSYTLNEIKRKFEICRNILTLQDESCQLFRIHNIDSRKNLYKGEFHDNLYSDIFTQLILTTQLSSLKKLEVMKIIGPKLINMLEKYSEEDDINILTQNLFDFALTNPRVKNEFIQTYMQAKIKNFIKLKYKSILIDKNYSPDNFRLLIHYITMDEKLDINKERHLKKIFSYLFQIIIEIQARTMDIYSLSRIFKFHYPRKDTVQFQPVESTNIIIYAGNDHTKVYVDFLNYIGGVSSEYIQPRNIKSCVRTNSNIPYLNEYEASKIIEDEKLQEGEMGMSCQIM